MPDPGMTWIAALTLVSAVLIGCWRPAWRAPVLLATVAVRPDWGGPAELPTWILVGLALTTIPAFPAAVRLPRSGLAALFLMPVWVALSAVWARQPLFVSAELGKWVVLSASALVAALPPRPRSEMVVVGAVAGLLPTSLWVAGERLGWVSPRGDPAMLQARLIIENGVVRGRALFQHPNRVAELLDQLGLLCAGAGAWGPLRWLAAVGLAAALGGSYATGSRAGLGVLAGGAIAVAALRGGASLRGKWRIFSLVAAIAAVTVAGMTAWTKHGGLGSRAAIYDFAWSAIRAHPIRGWGGGNYPLVLSAAPPELNRAFFGQHCHSLVLQIWLELGIIGVMAAALTFIGPLALGLLRLARDDRGTSDGENLHPGLTIGASAALIGLLLHNSVSYFFTQPAHGILPGVLLGLVLPLSTGEVAADTEHAARGAP